jgi:hypothetical protein
MVENAKVFHDLTPEAREMEECPLDLLEFEENDDVVQLKCAENHIFHV